MKVLVINAGSSSLKYQLIDMENEAVIAKGGIDRIGLEGSKLKHKANGEETVIEKDMHNHEEAIQLVLETLTDAKVGVISSMDEIGAVGHRVVHGGDKFACSVKITDEVIEMMESLIDLAPLHNPANLQGIAACKAVMPNTPMVGVFDTAFHQTMPAISYIYGIPYEAYEDFKVRRYGFHGSSHRFVSARCAEILGKKPEELNIVSCHLGNGSSIAAVKGGKCLDTTMGLTPIEGLPMGTRCGNIDPALIRFLMNKYNMTIDEMDSYLNKKSGMLGISGVSSDFRDLSAAAEAGNKRAQLALDIFCYNVKKFIGAYAAAMGGVDAIVFTAGVGENDDVVRAGSVTGLEFLGAKMNYELNKTVHGKETIVSTDDSAVKIVVIPTNEELVIARDTAELANL
ncbi:MAG: acetate kinase [Clostridia bacterium]|nr:acetate kinase [Clostridia bacterium]